MLCSTTWLPLVRLHGCRNNKLGHLGTATNPQIVLIGRLADAFGGWMERCIARKYFWESTAAYGTIAAKAEAYGAEFGRPLLLHPRHDTVHHMVAHRVVP